ncbi:MAG: formate--tetrahydrofolate ligase [Isosphaeraceae bacterium]
MTRTDGARQRPIVEVARDLDIAEDFLEPYGRDKAKVRLEALAAAGREPGKLILVSAVTPTPAGEGKTTMSIGLAQGLRRIGKRAALALRQPSMGPVFGRKGGATGGGASRVEPSDTINLQFTGDFHAITSAHNLLAAAIDNHLHFRDFNLDPTKVLWKRVLDVNDRALRHIVIGLGGPTQGIPRESGFDITAASEVMAVLCLADSREDLRSRLDRILVGFTNSGEPVLARDLRVVGSMAALLREAIRPNLVQTTESVPAFVHGGPFANIAHGCNSVLATRMALNLADYAVTEAGFAFDLGGEKFFDLKCRSAGLNPSAVVIVATIRALKMHGGAPLDETKQPNSAAVARGLVNLAAHLDSAAHFGKPVVVAINQFSTDTVEEHSLVHNFCADRDVPCSTANVFGEGGRGAADLAEKVVTATAVPETPLTTLYPLDWPAERKIGEIARVMYGAAEVNIQQEAESKLKKARKLGYGLLPICMAKTQDSLSDNPKLRGRPQGFTVHVREVEIAAGAGFLVALTGEITRMPGLPERPAAEHIDIDADGHITGLS